MISVNRGENVYICTSTINDLFTINEETIFRLQIQSKYVYMEIMEDHGNALWPSWIVSSTITLEWIVFTNGEPDNQQNNINKWDN